MLAELNRIEQRALKALEATQDETSLEIWRVAYLGRSAPLMPIFDQLGKLSKEERPAVGKRANEVKQCFGSCIHRPVGELTPIKPATLTAVRASGCYSTRARIPDRTAPPCHNFHAQSHTRLCRYGVPGLPLSGSRNG